MSGVDNILGDELGTFHCEPSYVFCRQAVHGSESSCVQRVVFFCKTQFAAMHTLTVLLSFGYLLSLWNRRRRRLWGTSISVVGPLVMFSS